MHGKYSLSDTEMEIMEYLWGKGDSVTTKEIEAFFNGERDKKWKRTTLNTHLSRLMLKDLVKRVRNVIIPYSREEFMRKQCQEILDEMYDGEISNLFAALSGGKEVTDQDCKEINEIFKRIKSR